MGGPRAALVRRARALPVVRHYPTTWLAAGWGGRRRAADFDAVRAYVLFVGQPRTGHSLVGALLDAHPDALIAHELDALKYVGAGFDRRRLYALLVRENRRRSAAGPLSSKEYDYAVPGQWQGRYRRLEVIGDKKGGRSTERLGADPGLLERLRDCVGVDVAVIHVVRNPYDVIATMQRRGPRRSLDECAARFFRLAATVDEVRARVPPRWFHELRHEELIAGPQRALADLCAFVGLDTPADYLDACASIVFAAPRRTRDAAPWTPSLLEEVAARSAAHPSLAGYHFEDAANAGGPR